MDRSGLNPKPHAKAGAPFQSSPRESAERTLPADEDFGVERDHAIRGDLLGNGPERPDGGTGGPGDDEGRREHRTRDRKQPERESGRYGCRREQSERAADDDPAAVRPGLGEASLAGSGARRPATVATGEDFDHRARLPCHEDRRDERRKRDLGERGSGRGHSPAEAAHRTTHEGAGEDQHFGQEQQAEHPGGEPKGLGPAAFADEAAAEIGRYQRRGDPGQEKSEPEQRRHIGQDALDEDETAPAPEARRPDQFDVLQIALAPASVAAGMGD